MLLKMTAGLSGPDFNLAPGDEYEFEDAEAARLIEAGFATASDTQAPAATAAPASKKKGKANVVSAEGDDTAD
jgi:hypothetical protein